MSREGGYPCVNAPGCPCHTMCPGYTCMACYLDPSRTRAFQNNHVDREVDHKRERRRIRHLKRSAATRTMTSRGEK